MSRGAPSRGAALVGFMGAGKTAVGREVAARLGLDFWELDEKIESAEGMSIPEIFSLKGEKGFRDVERDAVKEAVSSPGRLIATGGGAFVDAGNRRALKEYGPVVFLDAAPETVLARLEGDRTRPLLACEEKEAMVRNLMTLRRPAYEQADITVSTDGKAVESLASEVAALLRDREAKAR